MLSTEYAIEMKGFTLFRDHADKRKYYYLPKGDVRIADDGRKLNYFAYVDSSMKGSLEEKGGFLTLEVELGPSEDELAALKEGFADLLPYAKKQALAEKRAKGEPVNEADWEEEDSISSKDEFVLAPVQFKDGSVKLIVMGEDSSEENPLSQIKIVGNVKPSLFGKQTAVFSVRLQGKEADLMYQMLTVSKKDGKAPESAEEQASVSVEEQTPETAEELKERTKRENDKKYINSHIAVVYDLDYKGIEPAHYVKITVDFKYVEEYWNHHFELGANFDMDQKGNKKDKTNPDSNQAAASNGAGSGDKANPKAGQNDGSDGKQQEKKNSEKEQSNISIAADVDVDAMFRDLINEGAIVVQQIDFLGDNSGSPLGADDPTAIELVKQLLSAELFNPVPLPSEDFSVMKDKDKEKPETPETPKKPEASEAPETPKKPEASETPETPKKPEASETPETPKKPEASEASETPKKPEASGEAQTESAQTPKTQASALRVTPDAAVVTQSVATTQQQTAKKVFPAYLTVAGEDHKISMDDWLKGGFPEEDYDRYAIVDQDSYTPYYKEKLKKDRRFPTFSTAAGVDDLITLDEWLKAGCKREEWRTYAHINEAQYKKYQEENGTKDEATPAASQNEKSPSSTRTIGDVAETVGAVAGVVQTVADTVTKTVQGVKETVQGVKDVVEPITSAAKAISNPVEAAVSSIEWKLNARMAYSYKKRKVSESLKRTYIFNKQVAMNHTIHPMGMISVRGTSFDVDKQVTVGRLGEGPFRHHEIVVSSALDFDTYHIEEILVDINHVDSTGTVVRLTKEQPRGTIEFYSERYRVDSPKVEGAETTGSQAVDDYKSGKMLSYKVTVIFKALSVKGFDSTEGEKVLFENDECYTSGKTIVIGPEDIACVHPIDIQTGSLDLAGNIRSAMVSLIDATPGKENVSIYNQALAPNTSKVVLMNPKKEYKAQIQYNIDNSYDQVPVTRRQFTLTTNVLKANELVINDPNAGMIRVSTTRGAATFDTISSIIFKFVQGDKEESFMLSKNNPVYYYITDYCPGAPEKILIKPVKVNYLDGTFKHITPDIEEISTETGIYNLDV